MPEVESVHAVRRRGRGGSALACLALAGLVACASPAPAEQHPVQGMVLRVIDASASPATLAPCLASRTAALARGTRFAAIRYRHWSSHFVSTVYAEVPAGMTVQPGQHLEIAPAQCSENRLAVILEVAPQ